MALISFLIQRIAHFPAHKGILLILFMFAPFLLAAKITTPTPLPGGPMIIITPNQGSPSAFELVRVTDDRVEVSKEGVRLQFTRSQIKQIRVPEAGDLVLEAVNLLSQVEAEDILTFETLAPGLETKIPALANQASRFGWLIPDASPTLKAVKQAVSDMKSTLRATSNLKETGVRIESMANGSIPLSATWEEQINLALTETNHIPYMKIRKDTLDRFLAIRRKIRLELTQANEEATARARNLLEDLHSELRAGTLTEAGSELLIKETRRYVERVLEPNERTNLESQLVKVTQDCHQWFITRAIRKSAETVQAALTMARTEIDTASPSVRLESVLPQIFQIRRLVADVPDCVTKESLDGQLRALEDILRDLPPPRAHEPVVEAGSVSKDQGTGGGTGPYDPENLANRLDNYLAILKTSATDWRMWAGLSVLLFLLNLRRRKVRAYHISGQGSAGDGQEGANGGDSNSRSRRRMGRKPAYPGVGGARRTQAWKDDLVDPLQHPNGHGDRVDVDAYGRIKKKRGNQR